MKAFKEFFIDKEIIFYLSRLRAKKAKQRSKEHSIHLLTRNPKYNYHEADFEKQSEFEKQFQNDFYKLFPSRKKWKDLGENSRYKKETKQKLCSTKKNISSLLITIKSYRKNKPAEKFVLELNSFIKDIQNSIEDPEYSIATPTIYAKQKDKKPTNSSKKIKCRPISKFTLKDSLVLSFTNKFLTQLFDNYFEDCSLAFRSVNKDNGKPIIVNHHSAIQNILKYKNQYKDIPLWVAECDIQKFYDSVNHEVIKKHFDKLINRAKADNPNLDISIPRRIFYKYLECYAFNKDVLPLNSKKYYWKENKIENGEFKWIAKDLKELEYYNNIDIERIGIPQGGALSGLIANIVLDYVDKKVNKEGIFYIRFCDDMILMHPCYKKCWHRKNVYVKALKELKLVPHEFCEKKNLRTKRKKTDKNIFEMTLAPFWKKKSKGPYKWDEVKNDGFPWIGFVGYEIHFNGFIRVRKCSLKKEQNKQKEVVEQIMKAIKTGKRASVGTIAGSAIHRLLGMSVGLFSLWNCSEINSEMCWKNGFQKLNYNKYSVKQLKELDRSRNKLYYKLKKLSEDKNRGKKKPSKRFIPKYNKPFSYYYQVGERSKKPKK